MGGPEMVKAGVEIVVDQRNVAASGFIELIPDLHRIVKAWRRMVAALRERRPDLVVLIDSSGFNLPFARRARRFGIPTLYYVSPQVWGWRTGRIRKIARFVNRLAVIFPFEPAVYAGTGVTAEFVGHPLVDRLRTSISTLNRASARTALGFDADATVVALLPGSRRSEMRYLLPLYLETARVLHARDPDVRFVLPRATSLDPAMVAQRIAKARLPEACSIQVTDGGAHEALCAADVALIKPGTSTLEATLFGCPLVVAAVSSRLTAALVRRLAKVDYLAMPNLIAGEAIVPELLQEDADPALIADALVELLDGAARTRQLERLAEVRNRLSKGGAARRAAEIAAEMIVARVEA
jgi:lipid-A-disaccharide synthase